MKKGKGRNRELKTEDTSDRSLIKEPMLSPEPVVDESVGTSPTVAEEVAEPSPAARTTASSAHCTRCGQNKDVHVLGTYSIQEGGQHVIRRRRFCRACGYVWRTSEISDVPMRIRPKGRNRQ